MLKLQMMYPLSDTLYFIVILFLIIFYFLFGLLNFNNKKLV